MQDIYQQIWEVDQQNSGVKPILTSEQGDDEEGYVIVDEKSAEDPDHKLFVEAVIPDSKKHTYELCKKLFNNYTLDQTKRESTTAEEIQELKIPDS